MVWDSTWQLEQAVTGEINNAHPPVMVRLWALTNRFLYGPAGMFAVQCAGYWAGLALIARAAFAGVASRVALVIGIGFYPPLLGILATVWKDSGALAALLVTAGLTLDAHRRRSAWPALVALPFAFYAMAVRFNNVLTILPLLWWIADALIGRWVPPHGHRNRLLKRVAVALAVLGALSSLTWAVNTVGVRRYAYYVAVPLWDLSQISLRTNELLVPRSALTSGDIDLEYLRWISRKYRCDFRRVVRNGQPTQDIGWTHLTAPEARAILLRWFEAIAGHPREYLAHRLQVTRAAMFNPHFGRRGNAASDAIFGGHRLTSIQSFRLRFEFSERPGFPTVKRVFAFCAATVLCRPWFYLVIAIVGISWRLRSENARFARSLMASGLLSVAPLLVIAPSTDFRYAAWLVATALIGTALIVSGQIDSRAKRSRRQTAPDTSSGGD